MAIERKNNARQSCFPCSRWVSILLPTVWLKTPRPGEWAGDGPNHVWCCTFLPLYESSGFYLVSLGGVPQMKGREGPRQNRQNLAFLLSPDSGGKNFLRSYYSPFTSIPSPVSFRDRGGETPHLWTPHTYTHTLHKNCVPGKARKGAVISIKTSEISMEGK